MEIMKELNDGALLCQIQDMSQVLDNQNKTSPVLLRLTGRPNSTIDGARRLCKVLLVQQCRPSSGENNKDPRVADCQLFF